MLSEEKLTKINALQSDEVKQILDTCLHRLTVVDVSTAMQILNVCRSRVYQLMTPDNTVIIGKHKFLILNK